MKAFAEWSEALAIALTVLYATAWISTLFHWWREDREWAAAARLKPGQRRFLHTHPDGRQEWMVSSPREEQR